MSHARADLVDVFARLLAGVVASPAVLRSETALAALLRVDPRRLQELRRAGLVTPARPGRGYLYRPGDIRDVSVMLALLRLGATLSELEAFFDAGRRPCPGCLGEQGRAACTPAVCCAGFLERLSRRMEDEITRLEALDALVLDHAAEIGLALAVPTERPREVRPCARTPRPASEARGEAATDSVIRFQKSAGHMDLS